MVEQRKKSEHQLSIESGGPDIFTFSGDIRGFREWTRKVGHSSKSFKILMEKCLRHWMALKEKGYIVKNTGDGFIASKPMDQENNSKLACEILHDMRDEAEFTNNAIAKHIYHPRPGGFRIRGGAGEAAWVRTEDGIDFLGAMVNEVSKDFQQFKPEIPCIVHISFKEHIDPQQCKDIRFKKESDELYSFQINDVR